MLDPVDADFADSDFLGNQSDFNDTSDSEIDEYCLAFTCRNRLFGRQKPLHVILGSGLFAGIILWRNKQISAYIFMGATLTWLLFERIGYHLITLVCHASLFVFVALFLWSNLGPYMNLSPPEFPEIILPQHLFVRTAISLTSAYNGALRKFGHVVFGRDWREFLAVSAVLWVLSFVGRWCNFLTFLYIVFLILMTVPMLYEKNEDSVDTLAEKALFDIRKLYSVLNENVLQKFKKIANSYKTKKQH